MWEYCNNTDRNDENALISSKLPPTCSSNASQKQKTHPPTKTFIYYVHINIVVHYIHEWEKQPCHSHLLLLKMMLVTFSSSANESAPIWWILFPVMKTVLAYPGMFSGTLSRDLEIHFTVWVAAKHSQPRRQPKQWQGAQTRRTPKNTQNAKMHMLNLNNQSKSKQPKKKKN